MYLYAEVDGIAVKARGQTPAARLLNHIAQQWPMRQWESRRRLLSAQNFADTDRTQVVEQDLRASLIVGAAHDHLMLTMVPEVRWFTFPQSEAAHHQGGDVEHRFARVVPGMELASGHLALAECRALALPMLTAP